MQFVHEAMDIVRTSKGILFDLDGVLWLGNHPIPGVAAVLQRLRDEGKKVMFVSNTSSRSKAKCLWVFEQMGVDVDPSEVFIASECAARYVAAESPGALTYVLGSAGLLDEARLAGLDAREPSDRHPERADYLIVGKDNDLNFIRLTCALRVLKMGARFVAVNCDPTVPVADGLEPGAGAIAAAISFMTGREPDVVVGKPGTLLLEMALSSGELTPSECVIIGDTPEADIAAGNALGMRTVLVLSGNSEGVEEGNAPGYPASMQPDAIIGSVVELVPQTGFAYDAVYCANGFAVRAVGFPMTQLGPVLYSSAAQAEEGFMDPFGETAVQQAIDEPMRIVIGFLMYLLGMLEVLTRRAARPQEFGVSWQIASRLRAFPEGVGKPARTAILCNPPLPADLPQA